MCSACSGAHSPNAIRLGHRANVAQLDAMVRGRKLSAHMHATYPLEKTAEALKVLAERKGDGVILMM